MNFRFYAPLLLAAGALLALFHPAAAQTLDYPETRKTDQTDAYFGVNVPDPYRWLEDDNADETKAWTAAENKVTFDYLGKIPYRSQVRDRLLSLTDYPKYRAPFVKGLYVFFSKNSGLQNQSVMYYQKGLDGTPEVFLDPNTFSADGTARLAGFSLSKDGKYAAYGVSYKGSDWNTYYVMEVATKKKLGDELQWVKFSEAAWRGNGFYYSRYPAPAPGTELTAKNENQKVYFHQAGTAQSDDKLIYEDTAHPDNNVDISATENEKYEILYTSQPGKRGNALFFREAAQADKPFTPIVSTIGDDSFSVVDDVDSGFLVQTNQKTPNQKVVLFDPKQPDIAKSKVVLPEQSEPLASLTTGGGKLFATYLKDVASRVCQYSYSGKKEREIKLPALGEASGFGGERENKFVFYTFTSYNYPSTIFRYDIAEGKTTVFRSPEIKGFSPTDYEVKQIFFKSKDGARVPMFVIYKKGLKRDGKNPTALYGYGGFNISMTPYFSSLEIGWLEQGGVYAVVNLRGGAEYGEKWHEAGMRLRKQNVFDDCIAAAETLVKKKYTSPEKLALEGGSNGGLLVGAVINQRPDLFRAAIAEVGVMDMLRFQKFTAGKFWTAEYGSSDDEKDFHNLLAFSPLHNIKAGAKYPAVLVTTADHDDRVVPAHSFKYIATLQEKADKSRPLLIRVETNSGHGSSSLTKAIEEVADVYSFLFYNLGVSPKF